MDDRQRQRNLDHCLKCSTCHTQCPVVANYPAFPGPKQLGPELERLRLSRKPKEAFEIDEKLAYCTNCKRCDLACPHGVKPSYYNLKNKAGLKAGKGEGFRDWVLAHNVWWGKLGSTVPSLANFILQFPLTKWGMGLLGIAPRDFPLYQKKKLLPSNKITDKKVLYYPGCYATYNEPEIIQSVLNILTASGYQVEIAPVDCCGTPMLSNGLWEESTQRALKNTEIFLKYVNKGYKIVTTCPSCGLTLKEEYGALIPGDSFSRLKENTWDLFELLAEEEIVPFHFTGEKLLEKAYYHVPCHLKAQGIGTPAADFLRKFVVKDLIIEDRFCCGISGTYGFKKEKYQLAMDIGEPLFQEIKSSGSPLVITDCGTCKLQIVHGTGVKTIHPAILLGELVR